MKRLISGAIALGLLVPVGGFAQEKQVKKQGRKKAEKGENPKEGTTNRPPRGGSPTKQSPKKPSK